MRVGMMRTLYSFAKRNGKACGSAPGVRAAAPARGDGGAGAAAVVAGVLARGGRAGGVAVAGVVAVAFTAQGEKAREQGADQQLLHGRTPMVGPPRITG